MLDKDINPFDFEYNLLEKPKNLPSVINTRSSTSTSTTGTGTGTRVPG